MAKQDHENRAAQSEKFKRAARELGCDEDEAAFDRALKQMKPTSEKVAKDDLPNDRNK